MTIKSMTGFARSDGALGPISWHWEVRSVNGRGLDVRLRLPPGYEAIEARIREAVAKRIVRGNLTVNLNIKRSEGETRIKLNEVALRQVLAALDKVRVTTEMAPPRPEALLGIKGVLEVVEPEESEADMQAYWQSPGRAEGMALLQPFFSNQYTTTHCEVRMAARGT